jgi:hypothetical protein
VLLEDRAEPLGDLVHPLRDGDGLVGALGRAPLRVEEPARAPQALALDAPLDAAVAFPDGVCTVALDARDDAVLDCRHDRAEVQADPAERRPALRQSRHG